MIAEAEDYCSTPLLSSTGSHFFNHLSYHVSSLGGRDYALGPRKYLPSLQNFLLAVGYCNDTFYQYRQCWSRTSILSQPHVLPGACFLPTF